MKAEKISKLTDSDLQHYKLHLACYNKHEQPLNVYEARAVSASLPNEAEYLLLPALERFRRAVGRGFPGGTIIKR